MILGFPWPWGYVFAVGVAVMTAAAALSAFRCLWHRHAWKEARRYFVGPPTRQFEAEAMTQRAIERVLSGYTVIELRCAECGDIAHRELPGDAR